MLFHETNDAVTYRFGEHIEQVSERAEGLSVRFSLGRTERYDLLIVAEGMARPPVILLCPARLTLTISVSTDNKGTTRVCISFRSPEDAYQDLSEEEKKKVLIDRISGTGWESKGIVRAISESDDFCM